LSAIGRRARRLVHRASRRRTAGTEPVRIDELVSPLRYDVLVRERFLGSIAGGAGEGGLGAAVASPEGRAYSAWFRGIVIPRFRPELIGDDGAIEALLADRVRRSVELQASFAAGGYDPAQPILLQSGLRIAATATGKRIERRLFAGDGCHRLALLRLNGVTELEPGAYRVETAPVLTPIDNTAALIPLLGLSRGEYFEFLSLSYSPGVSCRDEAELRGRVASRTPGRSAELDGVLAADLPLLADV
jgi:hypothetical protein